MKISIFSIEISSTFDLPTAAKILPQFASLANNAVLTNGEWATVYATSRQSSTEDRPPTFISKNLVAPSQSLIIIWANVFVISFSAF